MSHQKTAVNLCTTGAVLSIPSETPFTLIIQNKPENYTGIHLAIATHGSHAMLDLHQRVSRGWQTRNRTRSSETHPQIQDLSQPPHD